jgi:ribosomal protein S18 acetylase RimI-like enzyme
MKILSEMKPASRAKIIDITQNSEYERYLYRCITGPYLKYKRRQEYLDKAISRGFRKKLLIFNGDIVGTIEYAPPEASYYPINGENIIVMNCIWVLRRAKGHNFGKQLMTDMIKSEKNTTGFATIGLENHWSGWLRKEQMERLGFKTIDSLKVRHKTKHTDQSFTMYLMWLPIAKNTKPPTWNKKELLKGITGCRAHPLYHPEKLRLEEIYEKC